MFWLIHLQAEVGMKSVVPQGGYFMVADWSALGNFLFSNVAHLITDANGQLISESQIDLSEKKYPEKDYCFAEWLTRVKKLAGIPPTAFYSAENKNLGENYIRFCFIKASLRNIFLNFLRHTNRK